MIQALVKKILGSEGRFARRNQHIVDAVNAAGRELAGIDLAVIKGRAGALREKAGQGASEKELLPETFALVREAAEKTIGLRHFDVQLLGGHALHQGMIAEMKTGEGKTLAATLPATLAALFGKQVHVVTVNDYLAARDAKWMEPVYHAMGVSVSVLAQGMEPERKKEAYKADVIYGTNNQFGFDYLNDNMVHDPGNVLQRGLDFAIVDEVDSILIDEARTPLAISGVAADQTALYQTCDSIARVFRPGKETDDGIEGDFAVDEKTRQVHLSDDGYQRAEEIFAERKLLHDGGLYEAHNLNLMHHLVSALRARHLFARDRDYVLRDNKIVIVDEHTGRLMPGRRWGDGLHQAIEAKEGLRIEPETQTLASVSLQNFYRMYDRLAGMTGTALTEAEEFGQIYGLEVAQIPTYRDMIRTDQLDRVYARRDAKLRNVVAHIAECNSRLQPVLVGTTTIEASEELSRLLDKEKIKHSVLNAKQHEAEAEVIAQAGMPGQVTISTSMAGRGTDIVLGGNIDAKKAEIAADESLDDNAREAAVRELEGAWRERNDQVVESGGLCVIGTERHEARRIDNQLRGRSGRQGDPGTSVFYLSFEDPLLRIFADARFGGMLEKLMAEDDEPLEVGMVTRVIEKAQRRMESYNFDIRKQLLEYDDITNDQRKIIYEQRRHILDATDIAAIGEEFATAAVEEIMSRHLPADAPEEEWAAQEAAAALRSSFGVECPIDGWLEDDEDLAAEEIYRRATEVVLARMAENLERLGEERLRLQKSLILDVIDTNWRAHLAALDHLRQGIGLRGFAQKNPKQEYRREAMGMFNNMLGTIRLDTARILMAVRLKEDAPRQEQASQQPAPRPVATQPAMRRQRQMPPGFAKAKRNDPCPCGSGRKFKHCHGKVR